MRAAEFAFVGALVHAHPWLHGLLQDHLDFYDGVLPHLLIADVERWAEDALANGDDESLHRLTLVLDFMEQGMSGGPHVSELISVSFLENLPRPGEPAAAIRSRLGPRCRLQLEIIT